MAIALRPTGIFDLDRKIIAATCMEFWEWAGDQTSDGHLPGVTLDFIDGVVSLKGFAAALESQGWLKATASGVSALRWERHNSKSAKRRALDAERKRLERDTPSGGTIELADILRTESGHEADKSRTENGLEKRREEKNKDKDKYKDKGETPLPPSLAASTEFVAAWGEWLTHRREKRAKLTPTARKQQLAKLDAMGPPRAIAALRHSMANGWTGVFEPDGGSNGQDRKLFAGPQPRDFAAERRAAKERDEYD